MQIPAISAVLRRLPRRFPFWECAVILGFTQTIAAGDETVAAVQVALSERQFYFGDTTGYLDEATHSALRRFQIRHGLLPSAEIDLGTLKALLWSDDRIARAAASLPIEWNYLEIPPDPATARSADSNPRRPMPKPARRLTASAPDAEGAVLPTPEETIVTKVEKAFYGMDGHRYTYQSVETTPVYRAYPVDPATAQPAAPASKTADSSQGSERTSLYSIRSSGTTVIFSRWAH